MRHSIPFWLISTLALAACGSPKEYQVDTAGWVPVRNGQLYLEVKSQKSDHPTLLWLHGGPGGAERPMFRLFNGDLEDDFRVAYLDQRGAGRSFRPSDPAKFLTVDQHLEDLGRVIKQLKADRTESKIILVGHSWGAQLALLYAAGHARDVEAVIAVNPVISEIRKQRSQFATLTVAARHGDDSSATVIRRLGAPPWSAVEEAQIEKAIGHLGGIWFRKPNFLTAIVKALVAGFIRPAEIGTFIEANRRSLAAMNNELLRLDLAENVKKLDVPVAIFVGQHDLQAPPAHAIGFLTRVGSPKKLLVRFEQSAHNVPFEEPITFNACLTLIADRLVQNERSPEVSDRCPYEIVAL